MSDTKVCYKCKLDKSINEFSKDKKRNDGLQCECKSCAKEARDSRKATNPHYFNDAVKSHFQRNPKQKNIYRRGIQYQIGTVEYNEELNEIRKQSRKKAALKYSRSEKGIAAKKRSNTKTYIKVRTLRVDGKLNNSDKYNALLLRGREKNKIYYKDNKHKYLAHHHKRRARIFGNGGSYTKEDIDNLCIYQKEKCAICSKDIKTNKHIDHIIPLSNGGTNDKSNIQLLCPPCNLSKGKKDPIEFMQQQGFLL